MILQRLESSKSSTSSSSMGEEADNFLSNEEKFSVPVAKNVSRTVLNFFLS